MGQHVPFLYSHAAVLAASARYFGLHPHDPTPMLPTLADAKQALQNRLTVLKGATTPAARETAATAYKQALDVMRQVLALEAQREALTGSAPRANAEAAMQGLIAAIVQFQQAWRLQTEQGAPYTTAERENDLRAIDQCQHQFDVALASLDEWEADAKVIPLRRPRP